MKKANLFSLMCLLSLVVISAKGYAQVPDMPLPGYLYVKGGNPAVMFTLKKRVGKVHGVSICGIMVKKPNMSKFEVGDDMGKQFMNYLIEDLAKIDLNPDIFIDKEALELEDMSFVAVDNYIREKLHASKVRYIFEFTITMTPDDKLVKKGKATREKFIGAILMIHKYDGKSLETITGENYSYMAYQADYKQLMGKFIAKVSRTPKTKLQKQLEGTPYYESPYVAYKEFAGFPADLADNEILIVTSQKVKKVSGKYVLVEDKSVNEYLKKEMGKNYPYNYKFISAKELEQLKGKNHYYLEPRTVRKIKLKLYDSAGPTAQQIQRSYYVIRDLSTNDVYYVGTLDQLEAKADKNLLFGLKDINKRLQKAKD